MKTLHFLCLAMLFSFTANSQITKGNFMVGGSGNFSTYSSTYESNGNELTNKGVGVNISPNIGYFFADKFVTGTFISISFTNPSGQTNSSGYTFGPFIKYYFLKTENRINYLAQISYSYGETIAGNNRAKSNGYGFRTGPVIFFNSSVAMEVTLDYNYSKLVPSNSSSSDYKNFQVGIGFQIHLEK